MSSPAKSHKFNDLERIVTLYSPSTTPAPTPIENSPTSPTTTVRTFKSWPKHDEVGESSRTAEARGSSSDSPNNTSTSGSTGTGPGPRKSRFREDKGAVGRAAARRGSEFTEGSNTLIGEEPSKRRKKWRFGGGGGDRREKVESWRVNIESTAEVRERQQDEERQGQRKLEREWELDKRHWFRDELVAVFRKMVTKKDRKGKGVDPCKCCPPPPAPKRKRSYRIFIEKSHPEAWWKASRP